MVAIDPASASAETSIMKAVSVLNCFRGDARGISLTELARRTGLPKSTVHRLCSSLIAAGYLVRDRARMYRLGVSVFELGSAATPVPSIRTDASRFLQQLSRLSGETSHLGVLDGSDVLYIDKIETMRSPSIPSRVGQRNPAHATGLGKAMLAVDRAAAATILAGAPLKAFTPATLVTREALLAEFEAIARQGVAFDREERSLGVSCVAAAVRNHTGEVVAGMSICGPADRMTDDRMVQLAPLVRDAARALSGQLGYRAARSSA